MVYGSKEGGGDGSQGKNRGIGLGLEEEHLYFNRRERE